MDDRQPSRKPDVEKPTDVREPSNIRSPDKPVPDKPPKPVSGGEGEEGPVP